MVCKWYHLLQIVGTYGIHIFHKKLGWLFTES